MTNYGSFKLQEIIVEMSKKETLDGDAENLFTWTKLPGLQRVAVGCLKIVQTELNYLFSVCEA